MLKSRFIVYLKKWPIAQKCAHDMKKYLTNFYKFNLNQFLIEFICIRRNYLCLYIKVFNS